MRSLFETHSGTGSPLHRQTIFKPFNHRRRFSPSRHAAQVVGLPRVQQHLRTAIDHRVVWGDWSGRGRVLETHIVSHTLYRHMHWHTHTHTRTEDGEFGPPGPQGSIRGLALVKGVIRQISRQDLQVVLAQLLHTQHAVPGPGWDTHTHTQSVKSKILITFKWHKHELDFWFVPCLRTPTYPCGLYQNLKKMRHRAACCSSCW